MNIEVIEATREQIPILQNLGHSYVYDLSELTGWSCNPDGLFGCRDDEFWFGDTHHFLVRVGGEIAGFACVNREVNDARSDWDVAEFFILRKFRGKGVGKYVARWLFDRFPGHWEVGQMLPNTPAIAFWDKVVAEYTGGNYTVATEYAPSCQMTLRIMRFESAPKEDRPSAT
jgi:predicted acetyltransferase